MVVRMRKRPYCWGVVFSGIDDRGEVELFPKILARLQGSPVGALVIGKQSLDARVWLPGESVGTPVDRVMVVGRRLERWTPTSSRGDTPSSDSHEGRYSRQVLALGEHSREQLRTLRVAVIGAGGIGSMVHQQLLHLGVGRIDVFDPDLLEESNLSRVVGSDPSQVGTPKVEVAMALRNRTAPDLTGDGVRGDVTCSEVAQRLTEANVVFCCSDNLSSRLVANRIAHQYYVPLIDLGLDVQLEEGDSDQVRAVGGRVMLVHPDGPCLGCLGVLQADALARETGQIVHPGYITGRNEPAPSVISFNGVVASLAVSEFLNLVTGYASRYEPVYHRYDGMRGVVRAYALKPEEPCQVCTEVLGRGDGLDLPTRQRA